MFYLAIPDQVEETYTASAMQLRKQELHPSLLALGGFDNDIMPCAHGHGSEKKVLSFRPVYRMEGK